jgi:hypothetical protein
MRIMIGLLVLAIGTFATAAMLSAAQHVDQVVTEQQDDAGIPPWITLDLDNWR